MAIAERQRRTFDCPTLQPDGQRRGRPLARCAARSLALHRGVICNKSPTTTADFGTRTAPAPSAAPHRPKGSGQFERIVWQSAHEIHARLSDVVARFGAQA